MSHCGKDTPIIVQSESVLSVIGAAIQGSQGTGVLTRAGQERGLPASTVTCPTFVTGDAAQSACLALSGFGSGPGQYLWRAMIFCQSPGPTNPGWWRSYHYIKFPSQAVCTNVKNSSAGVTSDTVTGLGLVNQTIELHYGSGPVGDIDNIRFAQNGDILFVYSDSESGWLQVRNAGTTVNFASTAERKVLVKGIHAKNYQTVYGTVRVPQEVYSDLKSKAEVGALEPPASVLTKLWDRTIASQQNGDRLFQKSDAASDMTATADSPVSVQWVGNVPVAKAGAVLRTQDNVRRAMGISTITTDLKYGDANCCWPTEGQLTTAFVPFFNLPSANQKAFNEEVVDFTASSKCGTATVTQRGGDVGTGKSSSIELFHCF